MQLPQWKTTIYCTKWCKVGFVTCVDRDPTRIGFRTGTVRVIHERLTFFCTFCVYMYADDTIIYCVRETPDLAIDQLNKALREFYNWSLNNQLTPHPRKSEVILFTKGTPMGPIAPEYLRNLVLSLVTKTKLLGLIVDQKLTWMANVFAKKLDLLKRSRLLPKGILQDFYFKVILPPV